MDEKSAPTAQRTDCEPIGAVIGLKRAWPKPSSTPSLDESGLA